MTIFSETTTERAKQKFTVILLKENLDWFKLFEITWTYLYRLEVYEEADVKSQLQQFVSIICSHQQMTLPPHLNCLTFLSILSKYLQTQECFKDTSGQVVSSAFIYKRDLTNKHIYNIWHFLYLVALGLVLEY